MRHRNRLSREAVDAPSLETFKPRLDGAPSNLGVGLVEIVPAHAKESGRIFKVPSNTFYDSNIYSGEPC